MYNVYLGHADDPMEFKSKQDAYEFLLDGLMNTDGAERERFANALSELRKEKKVKKYAKRR